MPNQLQMQSYHHGQGTGEIVIHIRQRWSPMQIEPINFFIPASQLVNPQTVELPQAPRGFKLDYTDPDVLLYLDLFVLRDVIRRAYPSASPPNRFLLFCAPMTVPEVSETLGAADDQGRILLTSDNVGAVVREAAFNYQPWEVPMYLEPLPNSMPSLGFR